MRSQAPEDTLVSPFHLQQQALLPPQRPEPAIIQKPQCWNAMPSDRHHLYAIFEQVQQDATFHAERGVHVLSVTDPLRAEHAALCLATEHILKRDLEVF